MDEFREFYRSDDAELFRSGLGALQSHWDYGTATGNWDGPPVGPDREALDLPGTAARVIEQALQFFDPGRVVIPGDWVGPDAFAALPHELDEPRDGDDRAPDAAFELLHRRVRAVETLEFLTWLGGLAGYPPEQCGNEFPLIALSLDPLTLSIADILARRPLDPPDEIPGGVDRDRFLDIECGPGLSGAVSDAMFALATYRAPEPLDGVTITSVKPSRACGGDRLTVAGAGFDAIAGNGYVRITREDGSCFTVEATVNSDGELSIVVPENFHGYGTITVMAASSGSVGLADVVGALDRLGDVMEHCLGPAGVGKAHRLRDAFGSMLQPCPPFGNPASTFYAGPPTVRRFTANGQTGTIAVSAPADVTLEWEVVEADQVMVEGFAYTTGVKFPKPSVARDEFSGTTTVTVDVPDGTRGAFMVTATNRCGMVQETIDVVVDVPTALVLQGGGTKGAFEVGAARCLRDAARVRFSILAGTSVGALNAAKLAEGRSSSVDELEALWSTLRTQDDFFVEQPWLRQMKRPFLRAFFRNSNGYGDLAGLIADKLVGPSIKQMFGIYAQIVSMPMAFYGIITGFLDMTDVLDGLKQALMSPSLFDNTPVKRLIDGNIDPTQVASSGIKLRIVTAVPGNPGGIRVWDEGGFPVGSVGFGVPHDIRELALASASIPVAFPPVPLRNADGVFEDHMDGGVLENTPIAAAVDAGAERVIVVLVSPRSADSRVSTPMPMLTSGMSAGLLIWNDIERADFEPYRGFGLTPTIVTPSFLVHGVLDVDPALVRINMDYGYMRAHDDVVVAAADRDVQRSLSDQITLLRIDSWVVEHFACGHNLPHVLASETLPKRHIDTLIGIRQRKTDIARLVRERVALAGSRSVPKNPERWWEEWEPHYFTPRWSTPWDEYDDSYGNTLPEASPP